MSSPAFKVIVVGGGPVGLTAAHALTKAGIDFLVLERRPQVVIDAGSNLVLSPMGLRTLEQLGLLKSMLAVSSPLGTVDRVDHQGKDLGKMEIFNYIRKSTGSALRVISRHDLTDVLYRTLPSSSQQKILASKKLASITPTSTGATVTCTDNTTYSANLVIGADGAHSATRDIMRTLSLAAGAYPESVNAETPFLTTYRGLWVRFPRTPDMRVGTVCESHGPRCATQLFVGEDSGVIGVYERLAEPTHARLRHTPADQQRLVDEWGHIPVTTAANGSTSKTLRDIFDARLEAGLVSLEEGVLDHWSWNSRIVLAGDAAHKYTPSTGAGCNTGMVDTLALVQQLQGILTSTKSGVVGEPSAEQIQDALDRYQSSRREAVVAECAAASNATATATWQTGVHRFIDRYVFPMKMVQKVLVSGAGAGVAKVPELRAVQVC